MSGHRSGVLELAVLGLLHETPMHGYELRKRLNSFLGAFRAFGYGSLYPCLKELLAQGLIAEEPPDMLGKPLAGRRSKIVYRLTAEGKERLQQLLAEPGPAADRATGVGRLAVDLRGTEQVRMRVADIRDGGVAGKHRRERCPAGKRVVDHASPGCHRKQTTTHS